MAQKHRRRNKKNSRKPSRTYIDVNTFIYRVGGHPLYGEKALEWTKKLKKPQKKATLLQAQLSTKP